MWLLPWEKLLPPFILGPLMFGISIWGLFFRPVEHWWHYVLLPLSGLLGIWATWVWAKTGENIFVPKREKDRSTDR